MLSFISVCTILVITNCNKKELTSKRIPSLKGDSLTSQQVNALFGNAILGHLQNKYDQNIKEYSIINFSEITSVRLLLKQNQLVRKILS